MGEAQSAEISARVGSARPHLPPIRMQRPAILHAVPRVPIRHIREAQVLERRELRALLQGGRPFLEEVARLGRLRPRQAHAVASGRRCPRPVPPAGSRSRSPKLPRMSAKMQQVYPHPHPQHHSISEPAAADRAVCSVHANGSSASPQALAASPEPTPRAADVMLKLAGKAALVTGGGTGIGRGIALAFASEGAHVIVCGRRQEALDETARLAEGKPGKITSLVCDQADQASVSSVAAAALEQFDQRIDILVNNAGINIPDRRLADLSPASWRAVHETNLNGPFYWVHAILPSMRARGGGTSCHFICGHGYA